jgi:hypothetical protein
MAKNKSKSKGSYRAGQGTGPQVAAAINAGSKDGGSDETFGEKLVQRKHADWVQNQIDWQRFLDAFEGGARYRNATYGMDRRGLPVRNLFRHKREYPDPQEFPNNEFGGFSAFMGPGPSSVADGSFGQIGIFPGQLGADAGATEADDAYEARRARTPVPPFVEEVVKIWLSKVYGQEVTREGPPELINWWKDVDGCGTPMDDYMRETVAPLLIVCGLLDVTLDRPRVPEGAKNNTERDAIDLGLKKCVASYIVPMNTVWWRNDPAGRFQECLIREFVDASERKDTDEDGDPIDPEDDGAEGQNWRRDYVRWRHWTAEGSKLYSYDGKEIKEEIDHPYGRVPIVRLIDQKKHRTPMIGKSRIEAVEGYQRAYYNKDSELTISDTTQALPLLSGPEDYCKADNTISVGPNYLLPMKKNTESGTYQGFEYVSPPKDPAASLRQNNLDIVDMKDRIAGLTKPAGVVGTTGGTVGQSGISKQLDAVAGNNILGDIAKSLARAERQLAEYAYLVLKGELPKDAVKDSIKIGYSTDFDLFDFSEIGAGTVLIQQIIGASGNAPNTERELVQAMIKKLLPGKCDELYIELDAEIEEIMEQRATIIEQVREVNTEALSNVNVAGSGSDEQAGGVDQQGQSGATMVSGASAIGY